MDPKIRRARFIFICAAALLAIPDCAPRTSLVKSPKQIPLWFFFIFDGAAAVREVEAYS